MREAVETNRPDRGSSLLSSVVLARSRRIFNRDEVCGYGEQGLPIEKIADQMDIGVGTVVSSSPDGGCTSEHCFVNEGKRRSGQEAKHFLANPEWAPDSGIQSDTTFLSSGASAPVP
jgi:hypothetical protein